MHCQLTLVPLWSDCLKQGKTALAERASLLIPETMGPEGYPIWILEELTASGTFVRAKMRSAHR